MFKRDLPFPPISKSSTLSPSRLLHLACLSVTVEQSVLQSKAKTSAYGLDAYLLPSRTFFLPCTTHLPVL